MAVPAFFAGGMIGVALAKLVGGLQGCKPAGSLPVCDRLMWPFLLVGAVAGALLVPTVVIWLLRRPRGADSGRRN